jgi:squalene-hopene/tetraprenyl-beta-curcumene cyclase
MGTQQPDGRWINETSNRWMEDDPALVTAYSLLTLQHVYRNL